MTIMPDAITLARAGAITSLIWACWRALDKWKRW